MNICLFIAISIYGLLAYNMGLFWPQISRFIGLSPKQKPQDRKSLPVDGYTNGGFPVFGLTREMLYDRETCIGWYGIVYAPVEADIRNGKHKFGYFPMRWKDCGIPKNNEFRRSDSSLTLDLFNVKSYDTQY